MLSSSFGVPTVGGLLLELYLPQETLGQLIGATRQRVNQIVKEWEAAGLISHRYGRVVLHDKKRFEQITNM
jgi:CRP-like cAMP-binding protein